MNCDPRVSLCYRDWNEVFMTYYFKGLCIVAVTTFLACIGQCIIAFAKRGFDLNMATQLTLYRTVSSMFFMIASFITAYHKNYDTAWFVELLQDLSFAIAISVVMTLATFLNQLRKLQGATSIEQGKIKQIFYWVGKIPLLVIGLLTPFVIAGVVFNLQNSGARSYLIFITPTMGLQLIIIYMVLSHARSENMFEARVVTNKIRNAFTFIAMVATCDICVSMLQLLLYNSLLESGSAVGWVILSSLKNILYAIQVASLAGMLCNSDFSEQGLLILKEAAVVELRPGTSEKAIMRKLESSSTGTSNKAEVCEFVDVKLTLSQELMWWNRPPKKLSDLFAFPNPICESDTFIHCMFTVTYIMVILISDAFIGDKNPWWLFIPMICTFFARLVAGSKIFPALFSPSSGPNLDLQAWLVVGVISPIIAKFRIPQYAPGPPRRFALLCGTLVSWTAFFLYLAGQKVISFYILVTLMILTILQAADMCIGCFVFRVLILLKLIPEDTCQACNVKFKTVELVLP